VHCSKVCPLLLRIHYAALLAATSQSSMHACISDNEPTTPVSYPQGMHMTSRGSSASSSSGWLGTEDMWHLCGSPCFDTLMLCGAEMASSNLHQNQLQREVKQLQALAAEKDGRLADAADEEQRLRQQLDHLREQLQQQGVGTSCHSVLSY